MERDIELTVRYAHAHMTGDAASIIVVTEHGRVTLRMHRLVLGNLAGTIARALWPRVEEPRALVDATPQAAPTQQPEPEPVGAIADGEAQDIAVQPEAEEPEAEHLDTVAISEQVPVQHDAPEPEAEHLGPSAGSDAHDIPTQDEAEEPQEPAQEVLAAFDTVWPKAEEPTAGVAPHDVPTQPEPAAPEAAVAAVTEAEPHDDVPTQPTLGEPDRDVIPSLAGDAPHDDPTEPPPPRSKATRPRRKRP